MRLCQPRHTAPETDMGYAAWDATTVRDLLVRVISDKMQEAALGGLGPAVKRRLVALVRRAVSGGETDPAHPMLWLKPGTKPVRTWRGKDTHRPGARKRLRA